MASSTLRFRLVGEDDASGAFLRVAAAAEATKGALDGLGASNVWLSRILAGSTLIPFASGAAVAAAELGTSLAAAGGAMGVFGLSAGSMVKSMVKQQQAIGLTQKALDGATKGTTTYKTELQKLHMQQQSFNQTFGPAAKGFENMKTAFQGFQHATDPVTKGVVAQGFNLIADVLPKLVPVSNAAGQAIGVLIRQLDNWVNGPEFKALLHWLATSGPKDIKAFGHTIGYVAEGIGKFFANFVGPGNHAAHTMTQLAKAFDKWAGSASTSRGINSFLGYVSKNGPAISSTLKSLATTAPKIATALGRIGSANLSLASRFLNLIAGLPQGAFNAIADSLMAMAVASKALGAVSALKGVGKLGGILGLGTGAGERGALSIGGAVAGKGVVPVYVTNKGFGPGGGGGIGGGLGGGLGAGEATAGLSAGAAAMGTFLAAAALTTFIGYIQRNIMPYGAKHATDPGVARGGVAAAQKYGTYQPPTSTPNIPGGAYSARGGQAALAFYDKLHAHLQAVATSFDAVKQHAAEASRSLDLVGHSADRVGGPGAKAIDRFNQRLATVKGGPASAQMDLIGQSADRNFGKAGQAADGLKGKINSLPGNKTVNVTIGGHAASDLSNIENQIRAIPTFKTSTITIVTRHVGSQVFATYGHTAVSSGGAGASAGGSGSYSFEGPHLIDSTHYFAGHPGARLLAGAVNNIRTRSPALQRVLSGVGSAVTAARSKYQSAVSARNSYAAGFQNFASSVFGMTLPTDSSGNPIAPTYASIMASQRAQQQQAATVKKDVSRLVRMHLSPALLKQLQAAGSAGLPELQALAGASKWQIAQLNKANASTMGDLHSAGMTAGNAIYAQMISHDKQQLDTLREIEKGIKELVKGDKGNIHIHLEGQTIVESVRKHQRKKGVPPKNRLP